ncbi:hypothetical protein C8R44DRAFT_886715 [Mycena epipterygia]|nr:hypothetical protein C8R44DRAFT_886715 [Mycena epipterygia]
MRPSARPSFLLSFLPLLLILALAVSASAADGPVPAAVDTPAPVAIDTPAFLDTPTVTGTTRTAPGLLQRWFVFPAHDSATPIPLFSFQVGMKRTKNNKMYIELLHLRPDA